MIRKMSQWLAPFNRRNQGQNRPKIALLMLAVCMLLTLLPVPAFAAGEGEALTPMSSEVEATWGDDVGSLTGSGTFAEALAAKAGYIQLQSAVALTQITTIDFSTTLDLNGNALTRTVNDPNATTAALKVTADLTVKSDAEGGQIALILTGATQKFGTECYTVYTSGEGSLTVSGGEILIDGSALNAVEYITVSAVYSQGKAITMEGGALKAVPAAQEDNCTTYGLQVGKSGVATLSGGEIYGKKMGVRHASDGALTISGTIDISAGTYALFLSGANPENKMTGGTLTSSGSTATLWFSGTGKLKLSGGTINAPSQTFTAIAANKGAQLVLSGAPKLTGVLSVPSDATTVELSGALTAPVTLYSSNIKPGATVIKSDGKYTITAEDVAQLQFKANAFSCVLSGKDTAATISLACTVTFDSQEATTAADPATKTVTTPDATVELPTPPTKTGFTFGGWFTEENGGGTEFAGETVVAKNITVYAKWTEDTPAGEFQPINGGMTYESGQFFANGNAITLVDGKVVGEGSNKVTYTKIYYTDDPEQKVIDLAPLVISPPKGNTTDGFDLRSQSVYGGSYEKAVGTTRITALGGGVRDLFGGGCKADTNEANIVIEGGDHGNIYGGSFGSGTTKTTNITITGGEISNVYPYCGSWNGTFCTVENIDITFTGGTVYFLRCRGETRIQNANVVIKDNAQVMEDVLVGNVTNPSLTVGGNVKIGYIGVDSGADNDLIASFTIDPHLGASASIGLAFTETFESGTAIVNSATASDFKHLNLPYEMDLLYELELDGSSVKANALPRYEVTGVVTDSEGTPVRGVTVSLARGNIGMGELQTDKNGNFRFSGIPASTYNLCIDAIGRAHLTKVITVADTNLDMGKIKLPKGFILTLVNVEDSEQDVVVGGLEEQFTPEEIKAAEDIENTIVIEFTATTQEEADVAKAEEIKTAAGEKTVGLYVDFSLTKTNGSSDGDVPMLETLSPLEIRIFLDGAHRGNKDYTVYRVHNEAVDTITTTPNEAGEYFELVDGKMLVLHAKKFSTYAIAYTEAVPTPPTTDDIPFVTTYAITATAGEGGTISPMGAVYVTENSGKTFTIAPNEGYEIADVLVDGASVGKVSSYTFEKITAKHTIEAVFKIKEKITFTDVYVKDWFYESVNYVSEKGLMTGTAKDTFSPYMHTSRGMVASILWRMEGSPKATKAVSFSDVPAGQYYTEAVAWAAEKGIVKGYGDGSYGPHDLITREQLAAILWRYAGSPSALNAEGMNRFDDAGAISSWATEAMTWAVSKGIISGRSNERLEPNAYAIRGETAVMVMRYAKLPKA